MIRARISDKKTGETRDETVRLDSLNSQTTPRHKLLPPELVERASVVWDRVARWTTTDREKWISGFLLDQNPDKEVAVWESIADVPD